MYCHSDVSLKKIFEQEAELITEASPSARKKNNHAYTNELIFLTHPTTFNSMHQTNQNWLTVSIMSKPPPYTISFSQFLLVALLTDLPSKSTARRLSRRVVSRSLNWRERSTCSKRPPVFTPTKRATHDPVVSSLHPFLSLQSPIVLPFTLAGVSSSFDLLSRVFFEPSSTPRGLRMPRATDWLTDRWGARPPPTNFEFERAETTRPWPSSPEPGSTYYRARAPSFSRNFQRFSLALTAPSSRSIIKK